MKSQILSAFLVLVSNTALAASIEVHGHRGARAVLPENSMPAFEYALKAGVDVIELDLGVTKDRHLVILHDPVINPLICRDTTKSKVGSLIRKPIAVFEETLARVKQFDCGSMKNLRFLKQKKVPGTLIPTLDEFFTWINASTDPKAKTVRFNIEMKSEEATPNLAPPPAEFAKLLVDMLNKHAVLNRTIIQSFDHRTLLEAKKLAPTATLSALIEDRPKKSLVEVTQSAGAQVVSPNHEWLTAKDVEECHKAGIKVVPWTANDKKDWKKLVSFGVDGIISDDPLELIQFLKKP
ncbi:MAG: glycerophosphodiester phosphodiesterase [Bdellovibrionales bacterium]|nr:glycerophosphodiester phosphodiesterase [Bdellovibrionales bacterium]